MTEKCSNDPVFGRKKNRYTHNIIGSLQVVQALMNFCFVFLIHIFSIYNIYICIITYTKFVMRKKKVIFKEL